MKNTQVSLLPIFWNRGGLVRDTELTISACYEVSRNSSPVVRIGYAVKIITIMQLYRVDC